MEQSVTREVDQIRSIREKDAEFLWKIPAEQYKQDVLSQATWCDVDAFNKTQSVTQKFWWEKTVGKVTGKKILNVGAGLSYHSAFFSLTDNTVINTDVEFFTIKTLHDYARKSAIPVSNALCAGEHLPFPDKAFDIIHISGVLHHVASVPEVLRELYRVLADDGILLLQESNHYFPFRWLMETQLGGLNPVMRYAVAKGFHTKNHLSFSKSKVLKFAAAADFITVSAEHDIAFLSYTASYFLKNKKLIKALYVLDVVFNKIPYCNRLSNFMYFVMKKKNSNEQKRDAGKLGS